MLESPLTAVFPLRKACGAFYTEICLVVYLFAFSLDVFCFLHWVVTTDWHHAVNTENYTSCYTDVRSIADHRDFRVCPSAQMEKFSIFIAVFVDLVFVKLELALEFDIVSV